MYASRTIVTLATGAMLASGTPSNALAQHTIDLDLAARCYLTAVEAEDAEMLASCFVLDGVVVDVRRRITGHEAIEEWAAREVIGGSLTVIEVESVDRGQRLLVHWAPRGSSGWRAHYTFTIQGGAIVVADLQYAR